MDSKSQTSANDAKLKSNLFDLAEKLRIQLHAKDQELEDKNSEIKVHIG
jgi:cell division protein FtsL